MIDKGEGDEACGEARGELHDEVVQPERNEASYIYAYILDASVSEGFDPIA